MENRPPQQETPRRPPNSARKSNGSGGPPTPPWLWLIVIGLLALIFWQFVPKTEREVSFHPWFTEQIDKGNIKSVSFQGNEIHGELYREENYTTPSGSTEPVKRFFTYAPTELMIPSIVQRINQSTKQAESAQGTASESDCSSTVSGCADTEPPLTRSWPRPGRSIGGSPCRVR